MEPLDTDRAADAVRGTGWRVEDGVLVVRYATGTFLEGVRLVQAVADAAEAANHHPDVTLTYPWVELRLVTHETGTLTNADLALALEVTSLAGRLGVAPTSPGGTTD